MGVFDSLIRPLLFKSETSDLLGLFFVRDSAGSSGIRSRYPRVSCYDIITLPKSLPFKRSCVFRLKGFTVGGCVFSARGMSKRVQG